MTNWICRNVTHMSENYPFIFVCGKIFRRLIQFIIIWLCWFNQLLADFVFIFNFSFIKLTKFEKRWISNERRKLMERNMCSAQWLSIKTFVFYFSLKKIALFFPRRLSSINHPWFIVLDRNLLQNVSHFYGKLIKNSFYL